MAKLSQQLQEKEAQQPTRQSRTQRVAGKQAQQRYELEKARFEALKEQAKKIQEEKFKDKVVEVQEQYNIYRPSRYDERTWNRMSQRQKDLALKPYLSNVDYHLAKRNIVVHSTATRTVTKTIPFTLEDKGDDDYSYKDVYETLSPDLKQFFDTPEKVVEDKYKRIDETKQKIEDRKSYADQKIQEEREKFEKAKQRYEEKREQYRRANYSDERYKEKVRSLKDWLNDEEDDLEEKEAYWNDYKKGLNEGIGQLNQGKELDYNSVVGYADDLGDYAERRKEARNEGRKAEREQLRQIKDLEEAGYKPFVVEQFDKYGNPKGVELTYINSQIGDAKTIAKVDVKGKVNVAGLTKAGFSEPQQRTFTVAGKDYKFQSRVPIFKTSTGEFVTPYEKTGITEQQLIKQSQDKAYTDWQKENKQNINFPYRIIENKAVYQGTAYAGQNQTLISDADYFRQQDKKLDLGIISDAWGGIKKGYKWVDDRVHPDIVFDPRSTFPVKPVLSFGLKEEPTIAEEWIDKGIEGIGKGKQNVEEWVIGKDAIDEFNLDLESKYQTQYQKSFESKYMKDLIYDQTSFEKASEEFKQSEEAKLLQRKYEEEYKEGYKELQTDVPFWKGTAGGVAQLGLGLGEFGLKTVRSPTRTVVTAGGVVAGVGLLKAVPTAVSLTATAGLGIYGTYKFVSPKSTYVERGGGLVTALLSFGTLGYAGYKYLKQPVVTTKAIKPPKATLKSSEVIGKDIKMITKSGSQNIVKFDTQKLSQTAQAGRRTVVTTKWRALSNKYLKTNLKNIYEGVPTQQLGKVTTYTGLRGTYTVREPSAYQKASKLLQDYGWTSSQAKATLRYYAPRVTEQYLDQGLIAIKGNKAIGEFTYLTKRPVLDVDKSLGIKTRGGSTIKDVYRVERKLVDLKGTPAVAEQKTQLSFVLDKSGRIKDLKDFSFSGGYNVGKATDLKKGFEVIKGQDLTILKEAQYRDLYGVSFSRKILPSDNILRIDTSKTKLINKIIDLRGTQGQKFTGGKKTPFSKTFGTSDKDLVVEILEKPKTTPSSNVNKIIDKIDDFSTPTPSQSKYYGTGLYERTDVMGGLSPTQTQSLQQQLKAVSFPDQVKVMNIKNLIKIKQLDTLAGLEVGQLSALKVATGLKSDFKLKSDLKAEVQLKNLLKEDVATKSDLKFDTALKTDTVLKSQLKSLLDLSSPTPPALRSTPTFRPPKIPTVRPPIPKPFVIPFLKGEISKRSKKGSKAQSEYAYLPDFTSRALGLEAETLTEKQAQKRLKKLLTGLEVRRGVVIR